MLSPVLSKASKNDVDAAVELLNEAIQEKLDRIVQQRDSVLAELVGPSNWTKVGVLVIEKAFDALNVDYHVALSHTLAVLDGQQRKELKLDPFDAYGRSDSADVKHDYEYLNESSIRRWVEHANEYGVPSMILDAALWFTNTTFPNCTDPQERLFEILAKLVARISVRIVYDERYMEVEHQLNLVLELAKHAQWELDGAIIAST